jgi:hypothetical protein
MTSTPTWRFLAWYAKLKPASSQVKGVGNAEVGDVVSVGGVDAPAKQARYSPTLDNACAAPAGPPPRPAPGSSSDEEASGRPWGVIFSRQLGEDARQCGTHEAGHD